MTDIAETLVKLDAVKEKLAEAIYTAFNAGEHVLVAYQMLHEITGDVTPLQLTDTMRLRGPMHQEIETVTRMASLAITQIEEYQKRIS